MKALVLSGGSGTRLRPFSHSMPKQLMPIANRPVLEHVLQNIIALGVTEIGIVVGDGREQIRTALGDGERFGVRITYIPQDRPLGLAHCVLVAREFLADEDFVMYLGDNVLPEGVAGAAEEFRTAHPAAQVMVRKVADPRSFGVAELDENGAVLRLVEKPRRPRSDLALMGVYFFTPEVHRAVAAIGPSPRGELEITDAVQWMLDHGASVRASAYDGYWRDAGRIEDVLECNRKLLDGERGRLAGTVDEETRLAGAVVLDEGARVLRSTVEGPVMIGTGSLVEDCHLGPYTTIGACCLIRGTSMGYSIALDGATVAGLRGLHGSIIGRSAVVGSGAAGSAGHRLVVGDHARVEVVA